MNIVQRSEDRGQPPTQSYVVPRRSEDRGRLAIDSPQYHLPEATPEEWTSYSTGQAGQAQTDTDVLFGRPARLA